MKMNCHLHNHLLPNFLSNKQKTNAIMKMKKIYYVVLTTFMLLFMQQTKAQDLTWGSADIATFADAAAASVLKSGSGITISQVGTQGLATVTGTPGHVLLNNTNSALNLNSTTKDAITIAVSSGTINRIVINMASNSTSVEAGPYVGYHSSVSAMGATTATTSSCNLTTTSGQSAIFDTFTSTGTGEVYEVTIKGNPNAGESSNYQDVIYGKIIVGTGKTGSLATTFINYVQESPDPRLLYSSGGNALTASIYFNSASVDVTQKGVGQSTSIRVVVGSYAVGYVGNNTTVRLKQIL